MSRTNILSLSLLAAMRAFSADIVTDGTFEAGGAAWATSGSAGIVNIPGGCLGASNFCGQYTGSALGNISQFVPTVNGATYTVSFWLRNNSTSTAPPDNSFHFQWGNLIPNGTSVFDDGAFAWTLFSADVVAESNSMWVSFQGYNNTGTFLLDNITVEGPDENVPEPSSWLLAGVGAAALLVRRRHLI